MFLETNGSTENRTRGSHCVFSATHTALKYPLFVLRDEQRTRSLPAPAPHQLLLLMPLTCQDGAPILRAPGPPPSPLPPLQQGGAWEGLTGPAQDNCPTTRPEPRRRSGAALTGGPRSDSPQRRGVRPRERKKPRAYRKSSAAAHPLLVPPAHPHRAWTGAPRVEAEPRTSGSG